MDLDAVKAAGRDARGRFQRGHLVNATSLDRVSVDHPALAREHAERVAALVADLGGMSQLSAMQMPLVQETARLQIIADTLGHDLMTRGVLTARGKQRAALAAYALAVDRLDKLTMRLGLERKAKPVDDLRTWAQKATNDTPAVP